MGSAGELVDDRGGRCSRSASTVIRCGPWRSPRRPPRARIMGASMRPSTISGAGSTAHELGDYVPWYGAEARILLAHASLWLADVVGARALLAEASRLARRRRGGDLRELVRACLVLHGHARRDQPQRTLIAHDRRVADPSFPAEPPFVPRDRIQLGVSANTVKTQAHAVYRKLGRRHGRRPWCAPRRRDCSDSSRGPEMPARHRAEVKPERERQPWRALDELSRPRRGRGREEHGGEGFDVGAGRRGELDRPLHRDGRGAEHEQCREPDQRPRLAVQRADGGFPGGALGGRCHHGPKQALVAGGEPPEHLFGSRLSSALGVQQGRLGRIVFRWRDRAAVAQARQLLELPGSQPPPGAAAPCPPAWPPGAPGSRRSRRRASRREIPARFGAEAARSRAARGTRAR